MAIPTEPIGSIPRPPELLEAMRAHAARQISEEQFHAAEQTALRDTIRHLEATGSPSSRMVSRPSLVSQPIPLAAWRISRRMASPLLLRMVTLGSCRD